MSIPNIAIPEGFASTNVSITVTVLVTIERACDGWGMASGGGGGSVKPQDEEHLQQRRRSYLIEFHQQSGLQLLTCQRTKKGECQANRNVACEDAELADCFVAVPDCSRQFAVAHEVDDDQYKENPCAQNCVEGGASEV